MRRKVKNEYVKEGKKEKINNKTERESKEEYVVGGKMLTMSDVSPVRCGFVDHLTGRRVEEG